MVRTVVTLMARGIIVVGVLMLVGIVCQTVSGSLAARFQVESAGAWTGSLFALALGLPVPFHVVAIGLILQRRWLSPLWSKAAWIAIVGSGCWLGVSLAVRLLLLGNVQIDGWT